MLLSRLFPLINGSYRNLLGTRIMEPVTLKQTATMEYINILGYIAVVENARKDNTLGQN